MKIENNEILIETKKKTFNHKVKKFDKTKECVVNSRLDND